MKSAKDIFYGTKEHNFGNSNCLDVYYSDTGEEPRPVLVFIHGGSWSEGSKDLYAPLGGILAAKGVTAVIISYRLAPGPVFSDMAEDCAMALKWVYEHIERYNGNRDRILLMGHSAGGHLAALITLDESYLLSLTGTNPVKGCILLDAFGLNVGTFLEQHSTPYNYLLHKVFTNSPDNWVKGSPVNFADSNKIPFLMLIGGNTYPFLALDNGLFADRMEKSAHPVQYAVIPDKSHRQMITQLENKSNIVYGKILDFVQSAG
jgi:acetyl esterase/lipase